MAETFLYSASVLPFKYDEYLYRAAYLHIPDYRRQKVGRYKNQNDKYLCICSWLLLEYGLERFGIRNFEKRIQYNEYGKPMLKDDNIFFNISHSGEYAICAVSQYDVGCDIEKKSDTVDFKIAKRFFAPNEYYAISAQSDIVTKTDMFYRYWTLKESFVKALGRGMKLAFDEFEISLKPNISVVQSVDNRNFDFEEYKDFEGYRCALCVAGKSVNTTLCKVKLNDLL